jgi:hypothetical protein
MAVATLSHRMSGTHKAINERVHGFVGQPHDSVDERSDLIVALMPACRVDETSTIHSGMIASVNWICTLSKGACQLLDAMHTGCHSTHPEGRGTGYAEGRAA